MRLSILIILFKFLLVVSGQPIPEEDTDVNTERAQQSGDQEIQQPHVAKSRSRRHIINVKNKYTPYTMVTQYNAYLKVQKEFIQDLKNLATSGDMWVEYEKVRNSLNRQQRFLRKESDIMTKRYSSYSVFPYFKIGGKKEKKVTNYFPNLLKYKLKAVKLQSELDLEDDYEMKNLIENIYSCKFKMIRFYDYRGNIIINSDEWSQLREDYQMLCDEITAQLEPYKEYSIWNELQGRVNGLRHTIKQFDSHCGIKRSTGAKKGRNNQAH